MAYYLDSTGLTYYDGKIKNYIDTAVSGSFKFAEVANNNINFYTTNPKAPGAEPVVSIDLPTEYFLDQTATQFVSSFTWSNVTYPNSTDPDLDGKPVMVLAVKGQDGSTETVSYSFASLEDLYDVYTGDSTSSEITVSVSSGNVISASIVAVDGSKLADGTVTKGKLASAVQSTLDAADTLAAGASTSGSVGYQINEAIEAITGDETNDDEDDLTLYGLRAYADSVVGASTTGKANLVGSATCGNFAGLDAGGDLTDSGYSPSSFDAAGAASSVLGTNSDTSSDATVYGAIALANEVLGDSNDTSSDTTVYGAIALANEVLGDSNDTASDTTVYGAIALANSIVGESTDTSTDNTIYGAKAYAASLTSSIASIDNNTIDGLFT